ncbi:MAG TPA: hypothetical protein VET90_09965 [Candidatus Binatus sp.]|nr:hypothetical protein [Candidatus Binatus sp.]
MNDLVRRALAFFIPVAALGTLACVLVYSAVQQDLRQGANDPQQQLAEDAVARLDGGATPSAVVAGGLVDVGSSLDPFVVVYDTAGSVLAPNGQLDGGPPMPPVGVLDAARQAGRDAVTWQPRPGVRIATVVLPWQGGTVLAGRSLRRVEDMISSIGELIALGWLGVMAAVAVTSFAAAWLWPRR